MKIVLIIVATVATVYLLLKQGVSVAGLTAAVTPSPAVPGSTATAAEAPPAPITPPNQFVSAAGSSTIAAYYGGTDPFVSQYPAIAAQNAVNVESADKANFVAAMVPALGMRVPFNPNAETWHTPCEAGAVIGFGSGASTAVGLGSQAASALVPGVGSFLGIFTGLFAKAQAQKRANIVNFEQTLCNVEQTMNQELPVIDAAVANGTISAADGITAMTTVGLELISQLKAKATAAEKGAMLWWSTTSRVI